MKKVFLILFFFCGIVSFAQITPDPGLTGTYAVSKLDYNLGDLAFKPLSFPDSVEVRGSVHYPTALSPGPFPVLLFLHGRHSTVYETSDPSNTDLAWPPASGWQSIVSYDGYDYLAQHMASHGYIVISISANAINATDNSVGDYGMQARGELVQHHLNLWNTWNTAGGAPFGTLFTGKLDLTRVGTMGHSRGGEGVVKNALYNFSLGSPYGIKAVLTLAPVNFERVVLNQIPIMNVAPYCDGDVSSLEGVHYYDDSRYNDTTDETDKYSVLMLGGNHNFYNTVWTPGMYIAGTSDDWDNIYGDNVDYCGTSATNSKRLTPARQQNALKAYLSAFFRYHIGNETGFAPLLQVDDRIPPVSSTLDSTEVFVSWHPPTSGRLDVNRTENEASELTNALGGGVNQNSLVTFDICGDDAAEENCGVTSSWQDKEPHSGSSSELGMSQLGIEFNSATDWYRNSIPFAFQDFSPYKDLQFRVAINFEQSTSGSDMNFTVELTDYIGNTSSVELDDYTNVMFFPPGNHLLQLPKVVYNTVKIPLNAFTGVDLSQVQYIRFLFDKTPSGYFFLTDLSVSGQSLPVTVNEKDDSGNVLIYPNPVTDRLNIYMGSAADEVKKISLTDIQGKQLISLSDIKGERVSIDLHHLPKGIYLVRVDFISGVKTYKIARQ